MRSRFLAPLTPILSALRFAARGEGAGANFVGPFSPRGGEKDRMRGSPFTGIAQRW